MQWFVNGMLIHETATQQWTANGMLISESTSVGNPWYYYQQEQVVA